MVTECLLVTANLKSGLCTNGLYLHKTYMIMMLTLCEAFLQVHSSQDLIFNGEWLVRFG
jgi:hypothetical protein